MPGHRSRGWTLLWVLFVLAAAPSRAELRQTPWRDLPHKLADRLIPAAELGVADCPTDVALRQPDRRVIQYIENVFYNWEEHDLTPIPGESFCVVLRQPADQVLTAGEAQVLLTASSLWLEPWLRSAEAAQLEAGDPALEREVAGWRGDDTPDPSTGPDRGVVGWAVSGEAPEPEGEEQPRPGPAAGVRLQSGGSVIGGSDDRTRVADTRSFPHRLIAYLGFDTTLPNGNPGQGRATGFLVGPYMALTNGHVVWDDVRRQFSRNLVVTPGQTVLPGGLVDRPFGTRTAVRLATNPGWVETAKIQYDYGAAFFDTPFAGISTYMPLAFDAPVANGAQVRVAGYPRTVKGNTTQDQWVAADKLIAVQSRLLRYRVDTSGGNSGGPVWQVLGGGQVRTIAVHSTGDPTNSGNSGARLVAANFELISEWLRWTPQTRNGLNLTINQVDPDGCPLVEAIVSVTDNTGKPVLDLSRANFTVNENGFPQVVDVAQAQVSDSAIAVALVLDASSSLSDQDLLNIKDASRRFVDLLGPRDKVAIFHFSSFVSLVQDYTSDKNLAKAAINALTNDGSSTALFDGIIEAANHSTSVSGRRALVAMTDGLNNTGTRDVRIPIQAAQAAGVPVFTIGFGRVDASVLDQIADETGGRFFLGASSSDLEDILRAIGRTFETQYLLTWISRFISGGQQNLEIQVADGSEQDIETTVYSQAGTQGCPPPSSTCTPRIIRPNGGEIWTKGRRQTIQWTTSGPSCGDVGLAISDGSEIWYLADTKNDGTQPFNIDFLPPGSLYSAILADRATGHADTSDDTFSIAAPANGFKCVKGPETLCLLKGRFQVRVLWRAPGSGGGGFARAVSVGDAGGYFWFFSNLNGELAVRMVDGRGANGHFWFFSGGLTSLDYSIFVTDSQTGETRVYTNVEGELRSFADDSAFGPPPETAPAPADEEPVERVAGGGAREDGSRTSARLPAGYGPPPEAQKAVLWNQTDQAGDFIISSENRLDAGTHSTEAADDFVVPTGKVWLLQGVDVLGAYYGPGAHGPAQSVNVFVYLDRNGFPGTLLCSQRNLRPGAGLGSGSFEINLPSACRMTAGRYWIAVQANLNFVTSGQWGWGERTAVRERGAVWRNPGNAYGTNCTDWTRRSSCGLNPGDFLFRLRGEVSSGGGGGSCKASSTVLCLAGKRFRVEATWKDAKGKVAPAKGTALTANTGYFSFGGSALDMAVKVVDGVSANGHHWVFYGGLTNPEYTIKVTDSVTGTVKTFTSPRGFYTSGGDTTTLPP